jgi:hypothetical protein
MQLQPGIVKIVRRLSITNMFIVAEAATLTEEPNSDTDRDGVEGG